MTSPAGYFTFPPKSTSDEAGTRTTSQRASASQFRSPPSPSPHRSPCSPCPHSATGDQSGAVTGPDAGQMNPPWDFILADTVRRTRTEAGADGGLRVVLRFMLFVSFRGVGGGGDGLTPDSVLFRLRER